MDRNTTFIGLDVSKETIAVAVAESGRRGEVRFYGTISSKPEAAAKLAKTLAAAHGALAFAYEAGPTGYGLHRQLTQLGHACHVVAPSMTPARPGSQIKTDRRDAVVLASLFRAGELTPIWVPDIEHEAMRDLIRARMAAVEAVRRTRQQLLSFLLRHGRIYKDGIKHWTKRHRRWLGDQRFDHPAQQIAFEEYNRAIEQAEDRRVRLERQIEALLPNWSLHPVVASIQALRGVSIIAAVTLVAEIGDFRASRIRASSWDGWGWSHANAPPDLPAPKATSPRLATRVPAACWWRAPGPTGCRHGSPAISSSAAPACPKRLGTSRGRHRSDFADAIGACSEPGGPRMS